MNGAPPPELGALRPRAGEVRELVDLAVPIVTVQVGMMLMGAVDTVMVGRVSPSDLAAVALGSLYYFTITVFGLGVLLALDPVISQAVGAGDEEGVGRAVQRGTVLALGLSFVSMLLVLPVEPILRVLQQPGDVIPIAAGYVRMAAPGIFPFYLFVVMRQTLQAMGYVKPVVWTILLANLANVLFNWIFVFGAFGAPALGAVGTGVATSLSRFLMAGAVIAAGWPLLRPHLTSLRPQAIELRPFVRIVRLGAPIGVQFGLEFGAFGVIGFLMGTLGTLAMASHQVAINLASLTFMVPLGLGQAASILVGRAIGREDSPGARRAAGAGLIVGGAFMGLMALLFVIAPSLLARVYTSDPEVIALAVLLIPIAGVFQVFDGLQVVASAVLRGIGDTRAPMVINIIGFWCIGFPVSVWVGFGLGRGPIGLWWGLVAGLAAVALLLLVRARERFSRDLTRFEVEEATTEDRRDTRGFGRSD